MLTQLAVSRIGSRELRLEPYYVLLMCGKRLGGSGPALPLVEVARARHCHTDLPSSGDGGMYRVKRRRALPLSG